jgi:LuxR family transcriptional regulator, maltose regulon positive regulatory protein
MGTTPTAGRVMQPVGQELIATKLTRPPLRAAHVARQRLMDALSAGQQLRVTLVGAPTGYGKTTLVAAWCAELAERGDRTVAWLSLTATENDPVLLTRYLIGAMRRAGASIGEGPETMLQVPGASPTAWMHSLVNELASGSAEMTLVLDD